MFVCDSAYNNLRSKYVVPLSKYYIRYDSLKNNNIKEILSTKFTSVQKDEAGNFLFTFEREVLFKALLGDIQLFYIKEKIQKADLIVCTNEELSSNWNIVSHYYHGFFCASLLLRLCFRGNIFLEVSKKKELEQLVSQVLGEVIKLESNLFYEVIPSGADYILKLSKSSANTHEIVWEKIDLLIDEMLLLSRKKSDEEVVLKAIKYMNNSLTNTYPSKLRNRVNYQLIYGIKYLDNSLFPINSNTSWLYNVMNFQDTKDDNQIANAMYAYVCYLELLCDNLIAEYFSLRGNENGLVKNINKKCNNKIQISDIKYIVNF